MAKHRRHEIEDDDDVAKRRSSNRRRGGSWMFWIGSRLLVVLILVGVLAYFTPVLIGQTGFWKTLLAWSAPEIAKQVDAKSLNLSWLSPIELQGLLVRDLSGQRLAQVSSVKSRKSLLAIAINYRDVGTFEVEEPKASIVLRADGSNVEDLLAKLPKSEGKGGDMGFGLVLNKGVVVLDDQVAGRQWRVENLTVEVECPRAAWEKKSGKLGATLVSAASGASPAQIAAEFAWAPSPSEKTPLGSGDAKLMLQGVPTEIVEGAVRRFAADVRPRGPLNVQLLAHWDGGSANVQLHQLNTPGIFISAPQLLATDQPTIVISSGKANIQLNENRLAVQELELLTNVLTVGGKGTAAIGGGSASADDVEIRGQVQLAELARQLPATLRLKADTQVNSGAVDVLLASQSTVDGQRLTGSLKTRDLRGIAGGRQIQFDQPLAIDFDVRQTAGGPIIERLVGQASFLKLQGRGSLAEGSITANADLDKLVEELDRLIDLSDIRIAGSLATDLKWKHDEQRGWNANADVVVQSFEAIAAKLAPWKEPRLHLAATVDGQLNGSSLAEVNVGRLFIEAGNDRLDAELTQSVKSPSAASQWPIKYTLRGDLAAWAARMQPFVPLGNLRMSGSIDATGSGNVSAKIAEIAQTSVQIADLQVTRLDDKGAGLAIREPVVKLETAGAWNQEKSALTLGSTTFASSTVAFRADGVRAAFGKEPSIVGTIDLRGDVGKISSWFVSAQPPTSQIQGGLICRMEIGYRGQSLAASWSADVDNLTYLVAPPPQPAGQRASLASNSNRSALQVLWQEPKVQLAGQGIFDPAVGTLKIERTTLAASSASLGAAGSIAKLGTQPEIDLTGEIAYDLDLVTQQVQAHARRDGRSGEAALPYGLDTLKLAGKEKRQFVLKGPLFAATGNLTAAQSRTSANSGPAQISEALTGEASLGWEGAQYVGLVAGPADFRAKLASGVVNIGPLDIPLSEGRLTTAPRIMLANRERAVVVERGPVLTNVRISPEMCSLWLKYVAPIVADATSAEGKFSLTLEGANVPLAAPVTSDVAGTLAIQSAQIGPGPLAQQYLGVIKQVRSFLDSGAGAAAGASESENRGWVNLPQQDVHFEVRDGAAVNRGLKMSIGDVVITTSGSVGIESQKINLLASFPLPDSWFKRQDGLFTSLKGQTIKIPIDGTLTQPRLDTRIIQDLGKQLAGSALRGVIGQQLERGLQGVSGTQPGATPPTGTQPGSALPRGVESLLPGGLGQGLNRLFGQPPAQPQQPQPQQPQPKSTTRPR